MRADGRVAIYQLRHIRPFRLTSFGTFPYGAGKKAELKLTQTQKEPRKRAALQILIKLNLFLTKIYSCRMLAMRAASLTATGITTNAATGFMCLDDLLGCQIHTTNNNQTNNPGCHTKHLFYFASTLITVSLSYFLAGRKSRYRNAIRKITATAVPKLNASPPTSTLPNW